jgi:lantibiotic modifying enzyme
MVIDSFRRPCILRLMTKAHATWRPLLAGELAERARLAVEEIAVALTAKPTEPIHPGFADGAAGRALYYAYLGAAWPGRGYAEMVDRYLVRAIDALAETAMAARLYGGFVGIAWVAEHLRREFRGPGDEDSNLPVDEALQEYLGISPWTGDYDLVGGLTGYGVYALERLPTSIAHENLARIVARLGEKAVIDAKGLAWLRTVDLMPLERHAEHPGGYFDLGVAHGVPGVVAVLAGALAAGVTVATTRPLFERSLAWLMAKRGPSDAESTFATGLDSRPARSAWCYGDPGIAGALFAATRAVGDAQGAAEALAIARHATTRSLERTGCIEAGLCHGAAGLALIYNRLWQATDEDIFADAARLWYARALDMRRAGCGVAGIQSYRARAVGDYRSGWFDDASFLTGAGGVGLALLAGISTVEPAWDRLLLNSLRTPSQS